MAAPNYGPLFQTAGQMYDIDPLLLQSIAQHEDPTGNPNARGPLITSGPAAGQQAVGVMQFLPSTAAGRGVNPNDPVSSIFGAARYLADLRRQTNDNLPQMLSLYGGDQSGTYAAAVQGIYQPLVAAWSKPPPANQVTDESKPLPPPGQRNASFNPPPSAPDVLIPQGTKGQAGQPAPGTPTTESSETPASGMKITAPSTFAPPPQTAAAASNKPPADFQSEIFGPSSAPQVSQGKPTPPQAQPPAATAQAGGDFQSQIFGAPAPQPSPAPAAPQTAPIAPSAPSVGAPAVAAPVAPPPAAGSNLTTPPQPSWFQANVADNPLVSTATGLASRLGAGLGQGVRDVGTTLGNIDQYLTANVPAYAAANRAIGYTPQAAATEQATNKAATQTYEQQHQGDYVAAGGRIGGNILATPGGDLVSGLGALGEAVPYVGRTIGPMAEWGLQGGLQNMLTGMGETPEQWERDFATGGVTGATLRGLGGVASAWLGRAASAVQKEAQDLGFNLSLGESLGGLAKRIESYTQYLPFSGTATKEAADRANVANILLRNMGMPETGVLDKEALNQARTKIGGMLDQIKNVTVDTNQDVGLLNDLSKIRGQAAQQEVKPITDMVNKVENILTNYGLKLPGSALHDLIENGSDLDDLIHSETPNVSRYAARIKAAILDAASRTSDPALYPNASRATKAAVDAFNQGRYYYKTLATVEPLVLKTGNAEDATYKALGNRIQGNAQNRNPNFDSRFQFQNDEMQKLGRVLQGPLQDLKSSGTGRELAIARLLGLEGSGGLALSFLSPENLEHYLTYVLAPTFALGQVGRMMRGPSPVENMLTRRLVVPYIGNQLTGNQAGAPAQ